MEEQATPLTSIKDLGLIKANSYVDKMIVVISKNLGIRIPKAEFDKILKYNKFIKFAVSIKDKIGIDSRLVPPSTFNLILNKSTEPLKSLQVLKQNLAC